MTDKYYVLTARGIDDFDNINAALAFARIEADRYDIPKRVFASDGTTLVERVVVFPYAPEEVAL